MALVLTQLLTEMSTRNFPGDKGWPARKAVNLTVICEPASYWHTLTFYVMMLL
jgi:hypothetical protein